MSVQKGEIMRETFVTIDQHSMDFIPSDTKPSRLKHNTDEHKDIHILFPIHHTPRTLLLQFKKALKQANYKCIQMCEKQLLIIRLNFMDRFKKLFTCKQPPKFILTITTHQFLSVRTVTIRPLRSNSSFSYQQIRSHQLLQETGKMYVLLQNLSSLNNVEESNVNELDSEYKQDFYSLDATSYYMFSRMLVDGNYGLGQKMQAVSRRFREEAKLETISKEDLMWLSEALNEISDDLLLGFNCSRKELLEILAYCRKSVEQYFHNTHQQGNANQSIEYYFDSEGYVNQKKQLMKMLPETMKQLLKLERSWMTMQIMKNIFMVGLIFKAECQMRSYDQDTRNRTVYLIKTAFSGTINEKTKFLKCSGYIEQDFDEYISKFNFDHEVTI